MAGSAQGLGGGVASGRSGGPLMTKLTSKFENMRNLPRRTLEAEEFMKSVTLNYSYPF